MWLLWNSSCFPASRWSSNVHGLRTWMPSVICDSRSEIGSTVGFCWLFPEVVRTLSNVCCSEWRLFWRAIKKICLYLCFVCFLIGFTKLFRHTVYNLFRSHYYFLTFYLCIYLFAFLFIQFFTYSFIHSPVHSFIHLLIHSFIHPLLHSTSSIIIHDFTLQKRLQYLTS